MHLFLNGLSYSTCANCNKCRFLAWLPPQSVSCPAGARPAGPEWVPVLGVLRTSQRFCWLTLHPVLSSNELLVPKGLSHSVVESVSQSDQSFLILHKQWQGFYDHEQKVCLRCLSGVSQGWTCVTHSNVQAQAWKCMTLLKVTTMHTFYSSNGPVIPVKSFTENSVVSLQTVLQWAWSRIA